MSSLQDVLNFREAGGNMKTANISQKLLIVYKVIGLSKKGFVKTV